MPGHPLRTQMSRLPSSARMPKPFFTSFSLIAASRAVSVPMICVPATWTRLWPCIAAQAASSMGRSHDAILAMIWADFDRPWNKLPKRHRDLLLHGSKGKKIAMSWAYSPSYGKPLSVPQGVVGLMTRFGMQVVLAHPAGYEVMPAVEEIAISNAAQGDGSFIKTNSMAEAFEGAHIVYPKSWAPFAAMEKRTDLYGKGDHDGISALEKELLAQNADHKDWECTEKLMAVTHEADALYMHCLPADITGVSCAEGEVEAGVFDRYRVPMYMEAGYKPYIIAAMIFLSKTRNPADKLGGLLEAGLPRMS